jgi:hypothetical protein
MCTKYNIPVAVAVDFTTDIIANITPQLRGSDVMRLNFSQQEHIIELKKNLGRIQKLNCHIDKLVSVQNIHGIWTQTLWCSVQNTTSSQTI